jgi:ABC-type transport system substrate-binding protein
MPGPMSWDRVGGGLRGGVTTRIALIAAVALVLAACSTMPFRGTPSSCAQGVLFNATNFHPCWLAANVNRDGAPVRGGTLMIEGNQDPGAGSFLDPQGFNSLERAYTRQLVSNPASTDLPTAESIVPDAATAMPEESADGLTYTFHIKSGVMWNTPTPRQVTSQDFKRGIERNCDPALVTSGGNPSYYVATIAGLALFCTTFEGMDPASSASARAAYINGHEKEVSGIQTPNSSTIVFTLTQPATDFLNILALYFASAAPVEELSHVPATAGNPVYSDGPYQVLKYDIGHEIDFNRNPEWRQSTDTIRHDYPDKIAVKVDLVGAGVAERVQNDLTNGAADLQGSPASTEVPAEKIDLLTSPTWNPQYGAFPEPGNTGPGLVRFNFFSPNNHGALTNINVRRALEYAIDKVRINAIFGGPSLAEPLNQVIGPGAEGYVQFNDYPTLGNQGDPAKCKALLRQAGVSNLKLKDMYKADLPTSAQVFQEVQSDFRKCGVAVVPIAIQDPIQYGRQIYGASESDLKTGAWDFTHSTGWTPDWFGPRNGRAILPDLADGTLSFPYGPDVGGYEDHAVDTLVKQAESAPKLSEATSYWHQADKLVMADAAFIPLQTTLLPLFRSARVHNAIYSPGLGYDITQIWLTP